jgi:hypothetical protein
MEIVFIVCLLLIIVVLVATGTIDENFVKYNAKPTNKTGYTPKCSTRNNVSQSLPIQQHDNTSDLLTGVIIGNFMNSHHADSCDHSHPKERLDAYIPPQAEAPMSVEAPISLPAEAPDPKADQGFSYGSDNHSHSSYESHNSYDSGGGYDSGGDCGGGCDGGGCGGD